MDKEEMKELIRQGDYETILQFDQLKVYSLINRLYVTNGMFQF